MMTRLFWLLLATSHISCCVGGSMMVEVGAGGRGHADLVHHSKRDYDIDLGVEQRIKKRPDEVKARIEEAKEYIKNLMSSKDPNLKGVIDDCKLKNEDCAWWSINDECEANKDYMEKNCGPVCRACGQLASGRPSIDTRCAVDPDTMPNAWKPGDLDQFFTNVTTHDEYERYEPQVLSRPSYLPGGSDQSADGPWVVVLENFVTQEEAFHLIELGAVQGFKPSYDVGKRKSDGTYEKSFNDGRTSTTAWCQNECYDDPVARDVMERIARITNINEKNSENLQFLKYEHGQFYRTHHDYIPHLKERQAGVRMLTVFIYLDDVDEGGETNFPELGVKVKPKRGRALIWPSVKNEAPDERDDRTVHEALPVESGVKYGVNAWIHQRDYQTPRKNGCG